MSSKIEYKTSYSTIFVLFYFIEGIVQGVPSLLFPPLLAQIFGGSYDIASWLIVYSIGNLPWSIKLIVGIFNDRWGSKKFGRRFPWIIVFGIFGAVWWFIMAGYLPQNSSIYSFLALYYFMIMLSMAFADTALDGLILDVVPKERLGKIQGLTWAMLLLGMGAGGMLLGLIFLSLGLANILFILTGILMLMVCILPYFIEEPPLKEVTTQEWGKDLVSVVTKKRNWRVFIYTFLGSIQAILLLEFLKYLILIPMGEISVDKTILSLTSGSNPEEYLAWNSIFYLAYGVGTVIGSLLAGKVGDMSRKKSVAIFYFIYIPFCVITILPFIFAGASLALIFGLIFLLIFGALQGALTVANVTVRGDLSRRYYPKLKSTFYAVLISLMNAGQYSGTSIGAGLLAFFAIFTSNFFLIYFLISVICSLSLLFSYIAFKTIPVQDYEFSHMVVETEKEVFFT
jgi:MFS family permease